MGAGRRSRIRHTLAVALRLADLHVRSRRMKHKLRILGRRQLALTQEIASLEARRRPALPLAPPGRAIGDARKDPIWIHAPWRAGSTYVWNKFRSCPKHLAFYEPFHETLETLTHADAEATTETSWPSGHPPLDAPYYREFEPLLMPGGGVRGFEQAFPYTYYFVNDEPLERQQAYLNGLVAHARARGRRPVFGFCRSAGRAAWFRRHMPGVHIALTRDGLGLWRSAFGHSQTRGNHYFLTRPLVILLTSRRDPWIADYLAALDLDPVARVSDMGLAQREAERLAIGDPILTMRAFAAVFALGTALSQRHADLVMPIETLSTEAGRRTLDAALAGRFDIALDWSDCAVPVGAAQADDEPFLAHWRYALRKAEACIPDAHGPMQKPERRHLIADPASAGRICGPARPRLFAAHRAPEPDEALPEGG
jgi:hypothetical protein